MRKNTLTDMDTILVNLRESQSLTVGPPIGLWSIRSNIPGRTKVWDNALHDDLASALTLKTWSAHTHILGISARFSSQHEDMLSHVYVGRGIADEIYVGGAHAAFAENYSWLKGKPPTDICRTGWGENFIRSKLNLPPRSYDELSHPVFSYEDIEPYWFTRRPHDKTLTERWIPVEFSRGCGRSCAFCTSTAYWNGLQRHSPDWIGAQLEYLAETHGITEVLIEDDAFNLQTDWAWIIIELLNTFNIKWSTPNGLPSRPLLDLSPKGWLDLARGCWRLSIPFETGCRLTADKMGIRDKFLEWEEAQSLVLALREHNIEVAGFFIIGYPGETLSDVRQTLAYANSLPLTDRYIYIATPYPGTPLYKHCVENGLLSKTGEELFHALSYRSALITTPLLSPEDLETIRAKDSLFARRRRHL